VPQLVFNSMPETRPIQDRPTKPRKTQSRSEGKLRLPQLENFPSNGKDF
jgi:hypothetical protein